MQRDRGEARRTAAHQRQREPRLAPGTLMHLAVWTETQRQGEVLCMAT